jgi:hypothetical protein
MSKVDAVSRRSRSWRLGKVKTGGIERDSIMPSPSGSGWRG